MMVPKGKNPLAKELAELKQQVENMELLLMFAVLRSGGRIVMTPDDVAETAGYDLFVEKTPNELIVGVEPRSPIVDSPIRR